MKNMKEVWAIAWPLIIANSFWNLQITIDRIFLGQYSTETLAATIGVTGFFWAPMALVQQTAAYVTTFVAQYLGAEKPEAIGASFWQSIYVSLAGGLLFLLQIPLSETLFGWVGHTPEIQALEVQYFKTLTLSALPIAVVASCSGFFTGLGHSRIIMLINGVGLICNVCFDYTLIFGNFGFPSMGIVGAGLATMAANYVSALFGFGLVLMSADGKKYQLLKNWRFNFDLMKRFIRFGVPSGLQWALEGAAFTFFLVFVGRLPNGDVALAASSITVTIMMLALLPTIGVAQGVSALVGQYLGQDQEERAAEISWAGFKLALIYIVAMGISFVTIPHFYMSFFKAGGDLTMWNQVKEIVPYLLIFVAVFVIFDSINIIFSFALKGAGDTKFVSLVSLVLPWPLMVLPTWYVSGLEKGIYWAWAGASLFIMVQAVVFLSRFLGGRWKSMRVI